MYGINKFSLFHANMFCECTFPDGGSAGRIVIGINQAYHSHVGAFYCITFGTKAHCKSYCSTVHFCRITSIYQPTNAHTISHKTLSKHFKNTPTCFDLVRSSSGNFVPC